MIFLLEYLVLLYFQVLYIPSCILTGDLRALTDRISEDRKLNVYYCYVLFCCMCITIPCVGNAPLFHHHRP